MTEAYVFLTDRNQQWELRKQGIPNATRRTLKHLEAYFWEGKLQEGANFGLGTLLFDHPDQSIQHWQYVVSNHVELDLSPANLNNQNTRELQSFYRQIQQEFLGYVGNHNFNPKDRAWIFKQIFGETYNKERLFPLILPTESENRVVGFSADAIARYFFIDFNKFFRGKIQSCYALHCLDYICSTLNFATKKDILSYLPVKDEDCDTIRRTIHRTIYHAKDKTLVDAAEDDSIRNLAYKVKSMLDGYYANDEEYQKLVDLVVREGPQI